MHQDSLNPWTLNFNQKNIEDEYRAHFANSTEKQVTYTKPKSEFVKRHQVIFLYKFFFLIKNYFFR